MKFKFSNLFSRSKLLPIIFLVVLVVLLPQISHAANPLTDALTSVVAIVVNMWVWVVGKILLVLINLVIWVAQYNNFINAPAVSNGWSILRDICNMFFILILLVIAFATTLNRESYAMKALLPKFIIAAILINFSKLICGVIIDFAQVIMLTFVNGFRDIGGGNLADMLGISKLLSIGGDACGTKVSNWTVMGTYILALLYLVVGTVVVTIILFILVMRMVMIWIYVVLSPLAWLMSVLPATQAYANQWWKQFAETVASGPILAFFIWLSFASATIGSSGQDIIGVNPNSASGSDATYLNQLGGAEGDQACVGLADSGSSDSMLKFIISIGLLMGGVMITKQAGGAVGAVAGKVTGAYKAIAKRAVRPVTDRAKAYQEQRESARKAKIQNFGAAAYGKQLAATGKIKANVNSALARGKAQVAESVNSALKVTVSADGKPSGNVNKFKNWVNERRAKNDKKETEKEANKETRRNQEDFDNRRQEAYNTNIFTDEKGNKFGFNDEDKTYRPIKKDSAKNDMINADGTYEIEKDQAPATENKQVVEKMSAVDYAGVTAWNNALKNSKSFNNNRQKELVAKEQKKNDDAGFTNGQLLANLRNNSLSQTSRLASALTLAVKEGFKTKGEVKEAQSVIKDSKNSMIKKDFNDTLDKKQAYLNYDLNNDKSKQKYIERLRNGKVEVQKAEAYAGNDGAALLQADSEALTKKEFLNRLGKITSTGSSHAKAIESGFESRFKNSPTFDEHGQINPEIISAIKATGRLDFATIGASAEERPKALSQTLGQLSIDDLAKIKSTSFEGFNDREIRQASSDAGLDLADVLRITNKRDADGATLAKWKQIYHPQLDTYKTKIDKGSEERTIKVDVVTHNTTPSGGEGTV